MDWELAGAIIAGSVPFSMSGLFLFFAKEHVGQAKHHDRRRRPPSGALLTGQRSEGRGPQH